MSDRSSARTDDQEALVRWASIRRARSVKPSWVKRYRFVLPPSESTVTRSATPSWTMCRNVLSSTPRLRRSLNCAWITLNVGHCNVGLITVGRYLHHRARWSVDVRIHAAQQLVAVGIAEGQARAPADTARARVRRLALLKRSRRGAAEMEQRRTTGRTIVMW